MRSAPLFVLLAIAVLAAGDASARTLLLKTQAGSVVHWSKGEIIVGVDTSASSRTVDKMDLVLAIERAAAAWNAIPASQPRFRFTSAEARDVTIRFCRGKWRGDSIDLGRSQFTASLRDGLVTAATVEFNECDNRFTPPGEQTTGLHDLQSVMAHELGHVLGLGHSDSPAAIMYPNGAVARKPHPDDMTALAMIYLGRNALQASPPLATTRTPISTASLPVAGRAIDASPGAQLAASAAAGPDKTPSEPPADSVSVLSLKTTGGRQMVVYTGEPTLLPPMIEVEPAKEPKRPSGSRVKQR